MRRTGRRDTNPELAIRKHLHAAGFRYRVDAALGLGVRRRADILFRPARVAVFVDGCFWHGCPLHATFPKRNADFWRHKIETNRRRDLDTDERLRDAGWEVVRIWEHENPEEAATKVAEVVQRRRPAV